VQDVSPSYLKGLHDQGIEATADNVIAMRVQDVSPDTSATFALSASIRQPTN